MYVGVFGYKLYTALYEKEIHENTVSVKLLHVHQSVAGESTAHKILKSLLQNSSFRNRPLKLVTTIMATTTIIITGNL